MSGLDQTISEPSVRADAQQKERRAPEDARRGIVMSNIASLVSETNVIRRDPQKAVAIRPSVEYAGVITMTPAEWAAVESNPRQRDTERHARFADHLKTPHPSHCKVNLARLADGRDYKLDGHTRSYLWTVGSVPAPETLYVDVWNCRTLEDAKNLYTTFDSRSAVETAGDQLFGAVSEKGLTFDSDVLGGLRFSSALRYSYEIMFGQVPARTASIYDLLKYWTPELRLLDTCRPTRKRFPSAVIASALITLRRFGPHALPFWEAYSIGGGWKADGQVDAVQAFEERVLRRASEGRISSRDHVFEVIRTALSAYDRHRRGETYRQDSSGIKSLGIDATRKWLVIAKTCQRSW